MRISGSHSWFMSRWWSVRISGSHSWFNSWIMSRFNCRFQCWRPSRLSSSFFCWLPSRIYSLDLCRIPRWLVGRNFCRSLGALCWARRGFACRLLGWIYGYRRPQRWIWCGHLRWPSCWSNRFWSRRHWLSSWIWDISNREGHGFQLFKIAATRNQCLLIIASTVY